MALRRIDLNVNSLVSFAGFYCAYKLWNGCMGLRKNQETGNRLAVKPLSGVAYDAGFQLYNRQSLRDHYPPSPCRPWWMHLSIATENQIEALIDAAVGEEGLASGSQIDAQDEIADEIVVAIDHGIRAQTEVSNAEFVASNIKNEAHNEMASSIDVVAEFRIEGEIEAAIAEEFFAIESQIEVADSGDVIAAENHIEALIDDVAIPEKVLAFKSQVEVQIDVEVAANKVEVFIDSAVAEGGLAVQDEVVFAKEDVVATDFQFEAQIEKSVAEELFAADIQREALIDVAYSKDVAEPQFEVAVVDELFAIESQFVVARSEDIIASENQIGTLVDDPVNAEEVPAFESQIEVQVEIGVSEVGEVPAFENQIELEIDVRVAEVAANKIEGCIELFIAEEDVMDNQIEALIDVAVLGEVSATEREIRTDIQPSEVQYVIPVSETPKDAKLVEVENTNESKREIKQKSEEATEVPVMIENADSIQVEDETYTTHQVTVVEKFEKIEEFISDQRISDEFSRGSGSSGEVYGREFDEYFSKEKTRDQVVDENHSSYPLPENIFSWENRKDIDELHKTNELSENCKRVNSADLVLDKGMIEVMESEPTIPLEKQKIQETIEDRIPTRISTSASGTRTNPTSVGQTLKNAFGSISSTTTMQIAKKEPATKRLCSGSFGRVYVAKTNQGKLAIKTLKSEKMATLNQSQVGLHVNLLYEEASLLSNLRHPNILSFKLMIPHFQDGFPGMATEFMSDGSLFDCLHHKGDQRLRTWGSILSVAQQIVDGMMYLHDVGIVHFDLKSSNILMEYSSSAYTVPICKVGDFGLAVVKKLERPFCGEIPLNSQRGTLLYMAPEVILAKCSKYTQTSHWVTDKVDVYFGVLMWELLMGELPYNGMTVENVELAVVQGLRPHLPEPCNSGWKGFMKDCYSGWKILIEDCWAHNVCQRSSFREIYTRLQRIIMLYYMSQSQNGIRP